MRSCRDNCNTCFLAINRHCFFIALCDRGSLDNDKIITDRHFLLVGHVCVKIVICIERMSSYFTLIKFRTKEKVSIVGFDV